MMDFKHKENSGEDDKVTRSHPSSLPLVWKTVQDWAANTTFHCMKYIFDRESHVVRRFLWLVIVLGFTVAVVYGFISQTNRYRRFQAITKDTIRFEDELEFPAVTFCSYCSIYNNTWAEEGEKQVLDVVMQNTQAYNSENIRNLTKGNISLSDVNMAEFRRKMGVTPENLFHSCAWQTGILNCTEVMTPKSVIHNYCYTFNYKDQRNRFVVKAKGTLSALTLTLFLNRDECLVEDMYGGAAVKYMIHNVADEPDFQSAPSLSPGYFYSIALTKHEKKLLPLPVKAFGEKECLDTTGDFKNPLKYYSNYSMMACEQECYSNFFNRTCGCVPYFLSDTLPVCDYVTELTCSHAVYVKFWDRYHQHVWECGCRIPCHMTTYKKEVSFSYIPTKNFVLPNGNRAVSYSDKEFIRENFVALEFYFDSKMVHVSEQILEFPPEDLIATFGGYLGLCIGASIMTLLELLEMVVMAMFRYCCTLGRRRQQSHQQ